MNTKPTTNPTTTTTTTTTVLNQLDPLVCVDSDNNLGKVNARTVGANQYSNQEQATIEDRKVEVISSQEPQIQQYFPAPGFVQDNGIDQMSAWGIIFDGNSSINALDLLSFLKHLKRLLDLNNIGCAESVYKITIHLPKFNLENTELPPHRVDSVRSHLIVHGLFPADWQPQTLSDLNAWERYFHKLESILGSINSQV
jgi:hypothetical protein